MRTFKFAYIFGIILVLANIFLNFSSNPPNGKSGAPGDGTCADCHNGGSFSGTMALQGIPPVVTPNQTYTATLTNAYVGTAPDLTGFQITARTSSNAQAGTVDNVSANATITNFGGKDYVEHNPAQYFAGNTAVDWQFDWTAPDGVDGESYTFYFSGVFANDNGSTSGDLVSGGAFTTVLDVPEPLNTSITVLQNVSCNGANDGAAGVTATGGTPPYLFSWSNGLSSATAFDLEAGSYTVTVFDALGQESSSSVSITEPSPLEITLLEQSDRTCLTEGMATVMPAGGTPPYLFSWSNGGTDDTQVFDAAGIYTLTVSDINACTATLQVSIGEDIVVPIADAGENKQITCTNNIVTLDGSSSSTNSGQISYLWSDAAGNVLANSATVEVDIPNTYTLLITDNVSACTATDQVIVTSDNSYPDVLADVNGSGILNCSNTSIRIDGTTSSSNATFQWFDQNNTLLGTDTFINVQTAGSYTLVVTINENGCTNSATATVVSDTQIPTANAGEDQTLDCTTTAVTLDATGSSSGIEFSYAWYADTIAFDPIANTLMHDVDTAGTYIVLVQNTTNGCSSTDTVIVANDSVLPQVTIPPIEPLTCINPLVQVQATVPSGTEDFTYSWTSPSGDVFTAQNFTASIAGVFNLTVTNVETGCSTMETVEIIDNTESPTAVISVLGDLTCANTSVALDAGLSTSNSGNTLVYEWINMFGNTLSTDVVLNVTQAGDYTLQVTDTFNGCTDATSVNIVENNISPSISVENTLVLDCEHPEILIVPTINTNGNTFSCQWTDSSGQIISNDCNAVVNQPDLYTLIVTDNQNGCTTSQLVAVQANIGTTTATVSMSNSGTITCLTQTITLDGTGSSTGADISYNWLFNGISIGNSLTIAVATPGEYTLQVSNNSNGCSNQATVTVVENTTPPVADAGLDQELTCLIDSVVLDGSGSSSGPDFTYEWTSTQGDIINGSTTPSTIVNVAGVYHLLVTNNQTGCTSTSSVEVSEAPFDIALESNLTQLSCFGEHDGQIEVAATGGTAPYSYLWNNGATDAFQEGLSAGVYSVTATDTNGCSTTMDFNLLEPTPFSISVSTTNESSPGAADGFAAVSVSGATPPYVYEWSNAAITSTIENLSAGTYSVTIMDANGCTIQESLQINTGDCQLEIEVSTTDVTCAGGMDGDVAMTSIGGVGEVTVEWSFGGSAVSGYSLGAGTYSVTATDAGGCTASATVSVQEPSPLSIGTDAFIITCTSVEGDGCLQVAGGVPPYQVEWSDGFVGLCHVDILPSLEEYAATVTDANGCTATETIEFVVDTDIPTVAISVEEALSCIVSEVTLSSIGSASGENYSYEWTDVIGTVLSTDTTATVSEAGVYTLMITDNTTGCSAIESILVIEDTDVPIADAGPDKTVVVTCANPNPTTFLDLNASSAGANISVTLAAIEGEIIDVATAEVTAGIYQLTVIDEENGCTSTDEVIVTALEDTVAPSVDLSTTSIIVCEGSSVEINVGIFNENYAYLWTDAEGNVLSEESTILLSETGTYTLTITNLLNGCSASDSMEVLVSTFDVDATITDATEGNADGAIDLTVSDDPNGYIYMWSNSAMTEDIEGLVAGDYSVTIQDAQGCEYQETFTVEMMVGLVELPQNHTIHLFPNPNTGQFTTVFDQPILEEIRIEIVDFTGQAVFQKNNIDLQNQRQYFDFSDWENGVYLVNFYTKNGLVASKKMLLVN